MIERARCQAHAFHSAVVIFFYRAIGINCTSSLDHGVQSILRNLTRAKTSRTSIWAGEAHGTDVLAGACGCLRGKGEGAVGGVVGTDAGV